MAPSDQENRTTPAEAAASAAGESDLRERIARLETELAEARETARLKAAEAQGYYRAMFLENTAPKLLIDPDSGRIADANPAALAFYGYSLEAIRECRIQDINTLDADSVRAERERARVEERRYFRFRHRLASGEIRDVEVYSGPVAIHGRTYLHSIIHDVTDAVRYRERLERYKTIFDTLPVGIYANGPDDAEHFTEINPAMARIFEADSPEALLGHPTSALYQDPDEREAFVRELMDEGVVHGRELRLETLKGRPIQAAITARARRTARGRVVFEGVVEDITERKRVEARLHESEQRYRSIITAMAEGVVFHDASGVIVDANPAAREILGLSDDELRGRHSRDPRWESVRADGSPFPGDQHPAMVSLRTGEEVRGVVMGLRHPEHDLRWISINAEPLFDEGASRPYAVVATFADITARKQAEDALREKEAQYRDLVENHPQFVERYRPDTTVLFVNRALAETVGVSVEQVVGRRWIDLVPAAEREAIRRHLREDYTPEQPVGSFENTVTDAEGRECWVRWTNRAFFDAAGEILEFQSVGIDITERRELEQARRRLIDILEASPDFISMADADGRVTYVNRGGRRLVGLPEKGPLDAGGLGERTAGEWAHPGWARRLVSEEGVPTALREGHWEGETALIDVHGTEIPVSQLILAHRDDDGRVRRLSTVMRDISRHKQLEQTLQRRQRILGQLQTITGDPESSLEDKVRDLLHLGARVFGLPLGILSRVRGRDYLVRQAVSPDGSLAAGQHFDLGLTYCVHTLAAGGPTGFHHAGESEIRDHPCYLSQGLEAYLGVPVYVGDAVYGTLNFSAPEAREPFGDFEWNLLRLMGQWVSYELSREAGQQALENERNLFIGGPTVVLQWEWAEGWPVAYVSPNVGKVFGHRPLDLMGQSFFDWVHPDDREAMAAATRRLEASGGEGVEREYRLQTPAGEYRWVYDFAVPDREADGSIGRLRGYLIDITERRALEAEQRLLATAFQTGQALMITDAEGHIERVNRAFSQLTGYPAEEAVGRRPTFLGSGRHGRAFYRELWASLEEDGHWEGEIWNRRRCGEVFPQWESISAVRDERGRLEHYVAVFHDISEQKRLERELQHLATHDRLTGIFNRARLYELLEAAAVAFERYGTPFSIVMFDVDHFKAVNDQHGHHAGDAVLVELARRVSGLLRLPDQFGRWGGEEFLVVASHTDREGGRRLAERIRRAVAEEPFPRVGTVTVSLGVAEMAAGSDVAELEEAADTALYAAKAAGRNRVEVAAGGGPLPELPGPPGEEER